MNAGVFHPVRVKALWVALLALLLLCTAPLRAQSLVNERDLMAQAHQWLKQTVAQTQVSASVPLRMEVKLGALDSRLKLASCAKVELYLPVGTRLWGHTRLGLRCLEGVSKWNVFLPVTVKASGRAWVVRRDVAPGTLLSEADLMQAEVDWAEELSPVLADQSQWLGQVAIRQLTTGQTLRQNMVRPAQVFQAGAQVRVLAQGDGYQISADGQALGPGVVGQMTRVKMENGRIMSATVLDARTVKLEL
jgi:flagellar basal body P-ring formation protein FlgA